MAKDDKSFERAIDMCLAGETVSTAEKRMRLAQQCTWEKRLATILGLIERTIDGVLPTRYSQERLLE